MAYIIFMFLGALFNLLLAFIPPVNLINLLNLVIGISCFFEFCFEIKKRRS